jgi:PTH2 family peptidyl-tRNA hydrolase
MHKQVIVIRSDLKMPRGKTAVQVTHASLSAYKKADKKIRGQWEMEGSKKVVLKVSSLDELLEIYKKAKEMKLPCSLIEDAGLTFFKAPTKTCVGIGPDEEERIDRITGKLKML